MDNLTPKEAKKAVEVKAVQKEVAVLEEVNWIDDPVTTKAKSELVNEGDYQTAADIADVKAVPMHHPESLYLKYGADLRGRLLMSGAMFVLQVAHPKVGAGVGQYSNFRSDPWHRLRALSKSGEQYIYKGREAGLEEGRRLRELHRNIKGVDKKGNPYHSLNPKVYGWVHTVFLILIISMCEKYGDPLSRQDQQILFLQWQEGGRVFGLRDKDMPRDIDDYFRYVEQMIEEELEYNEVMDYMLSLDVRPPVKPNEYIPDFIWNSLWQPLGKRYRDLAMFALPEAYVKKIAEHQPWSEADQQRMEKQAKRIKRLFNLLPERYRYDAKAYAVMKSSGVA